MSGSPGEDGVAVAGDLSGGDDVPDVFERHEEETPEQMLVDMTPKEFFVEFHGWDEDDWVTPGARVWIAPEQHDWNLATTDQDGVLRLKWRGRTASVVLNWVVPGDASGGSRLRRVELEAGRLRQIAFRTRRGHHGSGGSATLVARGSWVEIDSRDQVPRLVEDADGWSWFSSLPVAGTGTPRNPEDVVLEEVEEMEEITSESSISSGRGVRISGIVRSQAGAPVADALVVVGHLRRHDVKTDSKGRFETPPLEPGEVSLRAGGGPHGLAYTLVHVGSTDVVWNPVLDRGTEFAGRLVAANGEPLPGWRVEIDAAQGGPWIDGDTTDDNGLFAVPNAVGGSHELRVFSPRAANARFEMHVQPSINLTIAVPSLVGTGVSDFLGEITGPDGRRLSLLEWYLWDESTGEGVHLRNRSPSGKIHFGGYVVEIGGRGFAWQSLGRVNIALGEAAVVGAMLAEAPTLLEVGSPVDGLQLCWMHAAVPSRVSLEGMELIRLPPGEYVGFVGSARVVFMIRPGRNVLPNQLLR